MGLNLVIGCHLCKERAWFYRGHESPAILNFYRAHWKHSHLIALSDDQSDQGWVDSYEDVGEKFGVEHPRI